MARQLPGGGVQRRGRAVGRLGQDAGRLHRGGRERSWSATTSSRGPAWRGWKLPELGPAAEAVRNTLAASRRKVAWRRRSVTRSSGAAGAGDGGQRRRRSVGLRAGRGTGGVPVDPSRARPRLGRDALVALDVAGARRGVGADRGSGRGRVATQPVGRRLARPALFNPAGDRRLRRRRRPDRLRPGASRRPPGCAKRERGHRIVHQGSPGHNCGGGRAGVELIVPAGGLRIVETASPGSPVEPIGPRSRPRGSAKGLPCEAGSMTAG